MVTRLDDAELVDKPISKNLLELIAVVRERVIGARQDDQRIGS